MSEGVPQNVARIGSAAKPGPPQAIAETLRRLADMAERGELTGIAFAGCLESGDFVSGWHYKSDVGAGIVLLGALQVLSARCSLGYVSEGKEYQP